MQTGPEFVQANGLNSAPLYASHVLQSQTRVKLNGVFFPADFSKPVPLAVAVVSLDCWLCH